jgi:hypothetical protein
MHETFTKLPKIRIYIYFVLPCPNLRVAPYSFGLYLIQDWYPVYGARTSGPRRPLGCRQHFNKLGMNGLGFPNKTRRLILVIVQQIVLVALQIVWLANTPRLRLAGTVNRLRS